MLRLFVRILDNNDHQILNAKAISMFIPAVGIDKLYFKEIFCILYGVIVELYCI